jgi:hypothetical protein
MKRPWCSASTTFLGFIAVLMMSDVAAARGGGGGNVMNSPGYQRRLQESRGFVTSYSNGYPERGPLYRYRHPSSTVQKLRTR